MYQKNKKQLSDSFIDAALSLWSKYLTKPQHYDTVAFQEYCLKKKETATPYYLFYACQVVLVHCTIRDIATFTQSKTLPRSLIDRLRNCLRFFNSSRMRAGYGQLFLYQTSIKEEFTQALKVASESKTHLATLMQIAVLLQSSTKEHIIGKRFVDSNKKFLQYLQKQERDLAALLSLKNTLLSPNTPPTRGQQSMDHADCSPESSPATSNLSCSESDLSWRESYNLEERGDASSLDDSDSDSGKAPPPSYTLAKYTLFGDGAWADLHTQLCKQVAQISSSLS